ncbi:MerR family transcriptional regulator [Deinococcus knuensis]|uniref:HTH-type transcriptional activator TipA n=1 Tax=Deinococcus knuensis TaxID=1837380 RepID=A0ABQ2SFA8_9DEIO|nr:MerR family transcriptional regulator [Deinococcus knuensis]GGS18745.1 HTH-type transcriptional activator TipA [Deinococcus knuensis]
MKGNTTRRWTVGEVSALTGVSVRTLHHYDQTGLLRPAERSESNYRLYTPGDLTRLRRILTWRALHVPLAEVAALLDAPPQQECEALHAHAARLRNDLSRTRHTLRQVQARLDALNGRAEETIMNNGDIRAAFDGFDPAPYEAEVQERWGDTDAYRQSAARTARHTPADWERIRAEMDALTADYLALMDAGVPPTDTRAQAVAARHRAHISGAYYDASPQMMRGLAQMWVADERFTRSIDRARPGLAAYQSAAVTAWTDAQQPPA